VVQAALDKIMSDGNVKRTTIVIAHRLSTITNADRIVVMRKGVVIEDGTHDNLMALETGTYRALRNLQDMHTQSAAIIGGSTTAAVPSAAGAALSVKIPTGAVSPKLKSPVSPMSPTSKKHTEIEEPDVPAPPVSRWRVMKLQLPEWPYILLGLFGAAVSGVVQPVFAIIYSEMIGIFFNPNDAFMKTESNKYIGAFFAIAIGHLIATVCRIGGFVHVGEVLTRRLRVLAFRALIRNEIGFFDDKRNSIGRLNTRLETDAADVRSGTGEALSMVFQAAAAILAGIIIAFIASWRLALVVCAIMPFLIASSLMQGKAFKGYNIGAAKALEESGHIASESVAAIRTVASLNLQNQMVERFQASLVIPQKNGFSKAASAAAGQGFSNFVLFSGYAVAFYAGGHFMVDGVLDFTGMMRVFLALTMASQAAGNAINWAGNAAQAERARRSIFQILDRKSVIDPLSNEGTKPAAGMKGRIEFRNVSFAYPSRKDRLVLTDFNLTIEPGQKVALVGPSGSGKSTVVQLLERFYDPAQGEILVDGVKISDLNLHWLRNQMGIVQQEPALMADSIAYNIEYGRTDTKPRHDKGVPVDADADTAGTYPPPAPDVVAAAKSANALSFVEGFKHGFATHCGARGTQLSGGQKQRIAIARGMLSTSVLFACAYCPDISFSLLLFVQPSSEILTSFCATKLPLLWIPRVRLWCKPLWMPFCPLREMVPNVPP
jgi:ATP-binding cassette subfamily B (MDR/TAP) protein 1